MSNRCQEDMQPFFQTIGRSITSRLRDGERQHEMYPSNSNPSLTYP